MPFDIERFENTKMHRRTEDVPVPDLAAFFAEDEPRVWTIQTLTAAELCRCNEAKERAGAVGNILEAVSLVGRDQIDALRFEDLLLRATEFRSEPERCQALCREALGLWGGDPFGDLYDDETFRLEAQRLEELRVGVMELEMEAELALGNYEIVVAELESAVEEHPYREHLWYLLIEALLRSERRVDALRACHRLDRALSEVGVDAGDQLRRVEERILGADTG